MNIELLKTFDEEGQFLGIAPREEVHSKGLWYETFHCWFISKSNDRSFIHFQIRSKNKKDYPNKLDISSAGHLLSNERIEDGIREVHEELGVNVLLDDLIYVGKIPDKIIEQNIIDKEYGHVYLYFLPDNARTDYKFEDGEVSGIVRIELELFERLWFNNLKNVRAYSLTVDDDNKMQEKNTLVVKSDFLPHADSYIHTVLQRIKNI
ncbi:NUDIX hydrolase [Salinicoccus sesuvii]|uniref:NUDIX hydrolase n=1 Tax=Salinicoccus sesuvii TaxID=868281 RepID=A0ABV7N1Q2_9STAP